LELFPNIGRYGSPFLPLASAGITQLACCVLTNSPAVI
jgi:hypothetical protein